MNSQRSARKSKQAAGSSWTRLILWLLGRCAWISRLFRVEHAMLLHLVRTKWLLEERRRRRSSGGALASMQLALMLAMYALAGLGLGALAFGMRDAPYLYVGVISSVALVLLLMPLLADFSIILFDTSDVELMASLPIDERTLIASRVTMIMSYVGLLLAAIASGPLILGMLAFKSAGFWVFLPLGLLQASVVALALVLILYLSALKYLDLARFRDALVYIQVGSLVLIMGLLQLGPRLADGLGLYDWYLANTWIQFGLPTLVPGALWRLCSAAAGPDDLTQVISGIGVTIGLVACCAFLARRGIVSQLAQMESSGGRALARGKGYGLSGFLGRRQESKLGRAGWFFFLAQATSDRTFKMRTLPSVALMVIPWVGIFIGEFDGWAAFLPYLVFLPYFFLPAPGSYWEMARFAESWEGSWIFDEMSDSEESQFVLGAMRGLLARTLLAPLLYASVIVGLLLGIEALFAFSFAASLTLLASLWFLPRYGPDLPFVRRPTTRAAAPANFALGCGSILCVALLGGVQWLLMQIPFSMFVLAPLTFFLAQRLWRALPDQDLHRQASRKRQRVIARAARS